MAVPYRPGHGGGIEGPLSLRAGAVVGRKYRLERPLGSGGMGEVHLAFHEQIGRRVAIKVLREQAIRDHELRARFLREATAAACLRSDHIAQVFDVGELESGAPYMVMEFLEGIDLSAYLAQRGALPVAEVLDLLWQVCAGIGVAHAAGVVHRDLKPANLFLLPRAGGGHLLKILDFGIAKAPDRHASPLTRVPTSSRPAALPEQLTHTATLLGSVRYMAPEQMESARDTDARADIWSIGVIGYKLLTGQAPFEGQTLEELFIAMTMRRPAPLAQLRPDAPPALVAAIERCLQPAREHRWGSVAELQGALAAAFPRAPAAPAAPAAGSSGARVALIALAGAVLGVLGLAATVVLIARIFTPALTPLPIKDKRRVEPLALLPAVRAAATKLEPTASLAAVLINGGQNGVLDLTAGDALIFTFTTRSNSSVTVLVSKNGLQSQSDRSAVQPASLEPRCRFEQAWKVAASAALPATLTPNASYGVHNRNAWHFDTPGISKMIEVDGQTCALLRR